MKKTNEQPVPQGKYEPAIRYGDIIYTSGMTPRKAGNLLYSGKILSADPLEKHRDAIHLAVQNVLNAAQACLEVDERLAAILQLSVYLNAEEGFTKHAKLADYASEYLIEKLGSECIGSRAAIGVASLPSNAPVEITAIGQVTK